MIWDGTKYFLFATGGTLDILQTRRTSRPGATSATFSRPRRHGSRPRSARLERPRPGACGRRTSAYFNGLFHVYYAGSTFRIGERSSVIGLATNTTLETSNKAYAWVDQGLVVQSKTTDNFNAIR